MRTENIKRKAGGKAKGLKSTAKAHGTAKAESSKEFWELRLYVAGQTPKSLTVTEIPLSLILWGESISLNQLLFLGLLFGSIITYFFHSREKMAQAQVLFQEERIKRLSLEKEGLETRLRLLQAQVEPHFLFNSLSNILSLLDTDSGNGKEMLADLIRYLRASLSRTRGKTTTLEQEIELIRAYINIYRVRMGDRLRYRIEIPDHLKARPFPPMLVQPLVENAIRHGLEPKIEGGEIFILAEEKNDFLSFDSALLLRLTPGGIASPQTGPH